MCVKWQEFRETIVLFKINNFWRANRTCHLYHMSWRQPAQFPECTHVYGSTRLCVRQVGRACWIETGIAEQMVQVIALKFAYHGQNQHSLPVCILQISLILEYRNPSMWCDGSDGDCVIRLLVWQRSTPSMSGPWSQICLAFWLPNGKLFDIEVSSVEIHGTKAISIKHTERNLFNA